MTNTPHPPIDTNTDDTNKAEDELRGDFRYYLELALSPMFDLVKVKQEQREKTYAALVEADMLAAKAYAEQIAREARIDELNNFLAVEHGGTQDLDGRQIYPSGGLPGWAIYLGDQRLAALIHSQQPEQGKQ